MTDGSSCAFFLERRREGLDSEDGSPPLPSFSVDTVACPADVPTEEDTGDATL